MEDKYSPIKIHAHALASVFIPGRGPLSKEVTVIIECKGKPPYVIPGPNPTKVGVLKKPNILTEITDEQALFDDRDFLGKVTVRFRDKEIPWDSLEEFWKSSGTTDSSE